MVVLTRRIENAARRSTIHRRMDRAAYLIARTLDGSGPAGVNEIARRLSLDGSTITRQLAGMQERGYVDRQPHPDDGRAWVIDLTSSGRDEMRAVSTARRQRFATFLDGWSEADVGTLGELLERFNVSLASAPEHPLADDSAVAVPSAEHRRGTPLRSEHRRSVLPTPKRRH